MSRRGERFRVRVDPIMCDGYGHCAELAPELVSLDEWGYPVIRDVTFGGSDDAMRSARMAVRGCPRQALWLESVTPPAA